MAMMDLRHAHVLMHGIASRLARFQCQEMLRHGTKLVGIVDAEAVDLRHELPPSIPIFPTTRHAVEATGANLSMVFNRPYEVKPAIREAVSAGIKTIVCFTEHVPVLDAIEIRHRARQANVLLIGPNSSGVFAPGIAKLGFFSEEICSRGDVGVITKSGSISYAVLSEMNSLGIGISTVVAIGGDRVKGSSFCDHIAYFQSDPQTNFVVLLGEVGGDDEERAAEYLRASPGKPVVAFVSGRSVPLGESLGHAGAIAEFGRGDYPSKVNALASAGVRIAHNLGEVALVLREWKRGGTVLSQTIDSGPRLVQT